jgi:hypothetical protein
VVPLVPPVELPLVPVAVLEVPPPLVPPVELPPVPVVMLPVPPLEDAPALALVVVPDPEPPEAPELLELKGATVPVQPSKAMLPINDRRSQDALVIVSFLVPPLKTRERTCGHEAIGNTAIRAVASIAGERVTEGLARALRAVTQTGVEARTSGEAEGGVARAGVPGIGHGPKSTVISEHADHQALRYPVYLKTVVTSIIRALRSCRTELTTEPPGARKVEQAYGRVIRPARIAKPVLTSRVRVVEAVISVLAAVAGPGCSVTEPHAITGSTTTVVIIEAALAQASECIAVRRYQLRAT